MSTIKVTPEQLHYLSGQVDQARQQLEHIQDNLSRQIMFLQAMWMGVTQERFYDDFARSRPLLQKALERMVYTSKELKDIATRFEHADAEKSSLGSVIGAVGAAAMMKSTGSDAGSGDKGYQMAQINIYGRLMWMPVNENGVPDQASLQAYQKDQGHLDINRMQAGHAEEPGEDLNALQIKAFENRIHPFTGEPVSDKYAQIMLTSLKFSQLFMAFQMVRGSMPGGKGPFRLPSSHPAVAKIKKNLEAAESRKANGQKKGSEVTGQASNIGSIVKEGNKTTYTNPVGNVLHWDDQHPKNINRDIDQLLNSKDSGKATEAKAAYAVRESKEVTAFSQKIQRADGNPAGDFDIVTKHEIIEVKKSLKAITDVEQFDKYVNVKHQDFFNYDQKKVILYIDKPLTNPHPNDLIKLELIKSKGVTIVNSLDELKGVLK
ncbi:MULTISPECIES: WXG100 family type VII secretion target [Paenibacillus]|uniref:WXG100 family type VII secretion target n=1 Tax=Paenibacillus pabuli TaxID=1472 RepID=A0A855Y5G8_9BACL|nr:MULTISPECIES: WXG100 family type VII secretion target [Paenibacillus]PWW44227.1 WXG100 family type VII secretion target [Paenibacillus pabuli]PXW10256.1 WXG100 family type VII secretion target [Paenibacillus taichungensis]QLG39546.1 WXG100 family type VII secretion target [Paenibacillus sp. E222]